LTHIAFVLPPVAPSKADLGRIMDLIYWSMLLDVDYITIYDEKG